MQRIFGSAAFFNVQHGVRASAGKDSRSLNLLSIGSSNPYRWLIRRFLDWALAWTGGRPDRPTDTRIGCGHARRKNMQTKKLTIALGALVAGAALGPAAFAQSSSSQAYQTETQNTAQTQNMNQQVQQMDSNNDGHVSRSEFDSYWKQKFKSADANNDGKLSKQELKTASEQMNGGLRISQSSFNRMWRSADTDNDGSLSQNEDLAYHNKMFRRADANNDGRLTKAEVRNAVQNHDESVASL